LCEHESLMEDEVEREGPTAAKLSIDNNLIWQIAFTLMMSEWGVSWGLTCQASCRRNIFYCELCILLP
jgi:hypothetical protein